VISARRRNAGSSLPLRGVSIGIVSIDIGGCWEGKSRGLHGAAEVPDFSPKRFCLLIGFSLR
jgi:hypothetical protein